MGVIRTFHPIGQGAFYTERHNSKTGNFTIVYDCGSKTLSRAELDRKIKSIFFKDDVIDVLFISHFHEDHINGIEILKNHCKIKKVIIPLIHNKSKIITKVENFINGFNNTLLINDPQSFFGENTVVISINENDEEQKLLNDNNNVSLSEITNNQTFESGTQFKAPNSIDWFFIPFNYKYDNRTIVFEKALNDYGLNLSDIDSIEKMFTHKNIIIKAYESVNKNLNETSMVLYSGKRTDDYIHSFDYCVHFFTKKHFIYIQSGCLYLGDVNLQRKSIVSDLKSSLGYFLDYIGTIQIPHHGSIDNFDISILVKNIRCAIFSYGTNNTYGHPSDKVIAEALSHYIYPYLVTEEQSSIAIQVT